MSKHTPGPWGTGTDEDAHIIYDAQLEVVADTLRDDGDGETEAANARLIAAAPELLAACEALHARLFREQGGRENSPWAAPLRLLSAAIAKAKG